MISQQEHGPLWVWVQIPALLLSGCVAQVPVCKMGIITPTSAKINKEQWRGKHKQSASVCFFPSSAPKPLWQPKSTIRSRVISRLLFKTQEAAWDEAHAKP